MKRRDVARLGAVLFCVWLPAFTVAAQPVRVVTWNLLPRNDAPDVADKTVVEAGRVLKELNPDVIVLEQVQDLLDCEDILQALKPAEYQVAVFSSFRDPQTGDLGRRQVAILSKAKASDPFWDTWQGEDPAAVAPGGFASALIHLENRNLWVFGVQLSDGSLPDERERESASQQTARESAARQLIQRVEVLRESPDADQAVVVAGDFNTTPDDPKLSRETTLSHLERAGFYNALSDLPLRKRITLPTIGKGPDATVDYIFTRDAGRVVNVQIVPVMVSLHYPVAGDLNLDAPSSAPMAASQAVATATPTGDATPPAETAASQAEAPPTLATFWQTLVGQIGMNNIRWLAGLLVGGVFFTVAGFVLLARRTRMAAKLAPAPGAAGVAAGVSLSSTGEIVMMSPAAQTGSATDVVPVVHIQAPAAMNAQAWQHRAESAERSAGQASEAVRRGLIGEFARWLRGGAVRRLVSDRAELLEAQRTAALKMQVVDERLTRVEQHIEQRTREYEGRIGELEKELAEAREENRELIRAKIAQVRAEMERERSRLTQQARVGA